MKCIIIFFTFFLQIISLSLQNKTNTSNDTKEKGYTIIRGYNYRSNETGILAKTFEKQERVLCKTNLVPGLNWMERGIDLNTLDFFPLGTNSIKRANGFAESVFEFSCNKKQIWLHKILNHTYDFPDEIQSLRDLSTGKLDSVTSLQKSLAKTKEELAVQAGLEFGYAGFGFSASGAYKQAKECLTEKESFMALTQAEEAAYEIELSDQINLSHKFSTDLNMLPEKYEDDPKKYRELFNDYGTHYFVIGRFGGSIVLKTEIKKSFLQGKTTFDIKGKLEAKFKEFAKLNVEVSKKEEKLNKEFNEQSSNHLLYFGGHKELVEKQAFDEWSKSVPLRPWLFSGKLKPIYKAIHDTKKAEQLKIAMNVEFAREAVKDIYSSIISLKKKKELIAPPTSAEVDWENVKKFFDITQKKFSFKDVEENMKKLEKLMRMVSIASEVKL